MNNSSDALIEWINTNAWNSIVVNDDVSVEAIENMCRIFITHDDAGKLSSTNVCNTVGVYFDIKREQIARGNLESMIGYVWLDEMAGSLCVSCISRSNMPLPFMCAIDTDVTLEIVVSAFLQSLYLEGIPYDDFTSADGNQQGSQSDIANAAILPVYTCALP